MTFATLVDQLGFFADMYILPFLYTLAFLFFIWGLYWHFFSQEEERRKKGREYALWGIFGLVVIFSVWSLVGILIGFLTGNV